MSYCPKCDMEFIDGITICTDCGGPLAESKEAAAAMKQKELADAKALMQKQIEEERRAFSDIDIDEEALQAISRQNQPARVYVDKAEKYDDLKSSATAFLMVGGVLLAVSALCWTNILRLPMYGVSKMIFQGTLTVMGFFSLGVFINTSKSARQLAPEIDAEKHRTEDLIAWFLDSYSAEAIDAEIADFEELSEEERSLKRFQIIQDYLTTQKDLPDPSYVDALSEEIYSKIYEG